MQEGSSAQDRRLSSLIGLNDRHTSVHWQQGAELRLSVSLRDRAKQLGGAADDEHKSLSNGWRNPTSRSLGQTESRTKILTVTTVSPML